MEPVHHYTSFEDLKKSELSFSPEQSAPSTERQLLELADFVKMIHSNLDDSRTNSVNDRE